MWETLVVVAIVLAAGLWLGLRIWRRASGQGGSSCGNCPGCNPGDHSRGAGDESSCPQHDPPARR